MSQENLETMIMQNFLGGKRGVLWDCASSELATPDEALSSAFERILFKASL